MRLCGHLLFFFFVSDLSITLTALRVLKTLPSVLLTTVKAGAKWRWSSYSRPADPQHQHKLEAEFLARRERDASLFLHHRTITTSKTRCEDENSYSVLCGQFTNATPVSIKYASNFLFFLASFIQIPDCTTSRSFQEDRLYGCFGCLKQFAEHATLHLTVPNRKKKVCV